MASLLGGGIKHFKPLFSTLFKKKGDLSDLERARSLIEAIDKGGIPLNAVRVNAIGRSLGLEVPTSAPMPETIERIRAALQRAEQSSSN